MLELKIINKSDNELPQYQTILSAGMDLRASLFEDIILKPMERKIVPTALYLELPKGYEAQIRARSGIAYNNGVTVLNAPGTIDADYRGEIKVLLINLSSQNFRIKNGDRIAQMIVAKHEKIEWKEVIKINETERNKGGYGHSGIH